jgi:hypothetical protein
VRGEPVAKLGEVDRAVRDSRAQELEHSDVNRERKAEDTSVLHREVHGDAAVLLAEGAMPPGERIKKRSRLIGLMASGERGGVLERAREGGLISGRRKPVSLREELVACEQTRQVGSISSAARPS